MARIAGVDLPKNKRMEIALTYIYGIGRSKSREILERGRRRPRTRRRTSSTDAEVDGHPRTSSTRTTRWRAICAREVSMNIKRLMDVGSYRGLRHRKGLPVRGQRTHTNARTRKGPRAGRSPARRSNAVD
ncbi:MAG: 30S ribosomal protein S13 [Desulfobacterales bacterium]|nr:30S ribosomal protein S13 [Desulfobacterales bacterium]